MDETLNNNKKTTPTLSPLEKSKLEKKQHETQINDLKKNFTSFKNRFNENTSNVIRLSKQKINTLKNQKYSEKDIDKKKKEYLKLKNQENIMIKKIKNSIYYKDQFANKKMLYFGIMSLHVLILMTVLVSIFGIINKLITCIIVIIFYIIGLMFWGIFLKREEDRNSFKFNKYDTNYKNDTCKMSPSSNKQFFNSLNDEKKLQEKEIRDLAINHTKVKEPI